MNVSPASGSQQVKETMSTTTREWVVCAGRSKRRRKHTWLDNVPETQRHGVSVVCPVKAQVHAPRKSKSEEEGQERQQRAFLLGQGKPAGTQDAAESTRHRMPPPPLWVASWCVSFFPCHPPPPVTPILFLFPGPLRTFKVASPLLLPHL